MSSDKEIHFFDIDDNYRKGPEWYAKFFIQYEKSGLSGECTPDYLLYSYGRNRIKEPLGEDTKLIFMLRNPTERAYSQFHFHIAERVEFRKDF
jgi:hypothetical protein